MSEWEGTDGANRAWQRFISLVTQSIPFAYYNLTDLANQLTGIQSPPIVINPPPTYTPPPPVYTPPPVTPPPVNYGGPTITVTKMFFGALTPDQMRTVPLLEAAWLPNLNGGVSIGEFNAVLLGPPNVLGVAAESLNCDIMVAAGTVVLWPKGTGFQRSPGGSLVIVI